MHDPDRSLYDPPETDEDDLWFLPGREAVGLTDLPLPVAPPRRAISAEDWLAAEAGAGRALARASAAFARFDERLRAFPEGAARIAVLCASAALEAQGDWVPAEKLALYLALREATSEAAQDYRAADWAVRRLLGSADPRRDLRGFLGRHATDHDGFDGVDLFGEPARGPEFEELAGDWLGAVAVLEAAGMPELARAGVAFHLWQTSEISAPGSVMDGAVLASVLGAGDARSAGFVPVTLGPRRAVQARGAAAERLEGWLAAVEAGCLRALLELDRVQSWQSRATAAVADLSGRTPDLLIAALVAQPVASAEIIAEGSGASKAAVRRNLAVFAERGLIREVTGQARFRFWAVG